MKFYFLIIYIIHSVFSIAQINLNDSASNFNKISIVLQVGHTKQLGQETTDFSKINKPNSNSPKLDSTYSSSPLLSYRFGTNYNFAIDKKCFLNLGINYAQYSSNKIISNSADVNINNSKIGRRDFTHKNLFISIGANFKFNKTIFNFTRYLNLYMDSKMINSFFDETKES